MPPKASLAMDLVSTTPSFSGFVVTLLCLYVATAFLLAVPVMAIMAGERGPGARQRQRRRGLSIHLMDDSRRRVLVQQSAAASWIEHPPPTTTTAPGTAGVAATA
ncbi:hypothetical protein PVAP13_8KG331700 [Panicum virgatum]|uniref:Uncharacterized protein n=1 Tax=Panicum virgatum TaxID=38727 RepID=A0A8T0PPK9_PANVG|nr:hypothetical protein PVAP13_8KG331700 [Panicum virgatum]